MVEFSVSYIKATNMFFHQTSNTRCGITLVELIGVILSITAGLCIGANYMGLDLNRVAYVAMDESRVLTQLPEHWRPLNPDCPNGDCPSLEEIREAKRSQLNSELTALQGEVALLSGTANTTDLGLASIEDEQKKLVRAKTKKYWEALTKVMAEINRLDERLDSTPVSIQMTENPAADKSRAMLLRRQMFDYAQKAIRNLDCTLVDPKVLSAGVRLSEWYAESADLVKRTIEIQEKSVLGDPPLLEKQAFSQAQIQHQKQTELIQQWLGKTESYLQTEYGLTIGNDAS